MVSYCSILRNFYVKDYLKIIWYLNQLFWAYICSTQMFLNSHNKSAKNIFLTSSVLQTQENKLRRGFGMSKRIGARGQDRSRTGSFIETEFRSPTFSIFVKKPPTPTCHQDPESKLSVTNIPLSPTSLSSSIESSIEEYLKADMV